MDRQQVLQGSRSKSWVGNVGLVLGRPGGAELWEGARGLTGNARSRTQLGEDQRVRNKWEKGRQIGEGAWSPTRDSWGGQEFIRRCPAGK